MSNQFRFSSIQHKSQTPRAIGYSGPPVSIGVSSVDVTCNCGQAWTAHEGGGLRHVIGSVIVSCPGCGASEAVPSREFGL